MSLLNMMFMMGELDDDRCPECGAELDYYEEIQVHTELDGNPWETHYIPYCKNCGYDGGE